MDLIKYSDAVWDRFFDFAFAETETVARNDVQESLKKMGIDLTKAMAKVRQALQTASAKEELAAARAKRPGLVEAMRSLVVPVGTSLRDKLRQMIDQRFQGTVQAAYFRKLEQAASDEDLQSLLEDMARLEVLEKEPGNAPSTGQ